MFPFQISVQIVVSRRDLNVTEVPVLRPGRAAALECFGAGRLFSVVVNIIDDAPKKRIRIARCHNVEARLILLHLAFLRFLRFVLFFFWTHNLA